ncbi:50S ribosomal protein L2 plastid [Dissostichus eleginoides]|uniref:50S ribosomal protein L2 plastid n=1 Tax=Dissostichus eleginoides TaxID=100907 RepID=A0AAD9F7B1_DISEL|nr:50S ribosomal protein L2 plastid [Dissostichus eleginoides]
MRSSLLAWLCLPSGEIQLCTAVCAGEDGERQGRKSWLRAPVMCSVVCFLKEGFCLASQEQNNAFACCAADSITYPDAETQSVPRLKTEILDNED